MSPPPAVPRAGASSPSQAADALAKLGEHLAASSDGAHDEPAAADVPQPAERSTGAFRWVPIRSLSARHRPRIAQHLLALSEADRYLRFGFLASDGQIGEYVDRLDFDHDEIFGVFNRRLQLVATAHLAHLPQRNDQARSAEFGVSVSAAQRGRGVGARLFDHAVLHARNRGVETLVIHALSENVPMLRIARSAGATLLSEGGDSRATLKLPPEDMASRVEALVEARAADVDYRLKRGAQQMDGLLGALAEVRRKIGSSGIAGQ